MSVELVKAISSEPRTPASDVSPAVRNDEKRREKHASNAEEAPPSVTVSPTAAPSTKPSVIDSLVTSLKKGG